MSEKGQKRASKTLPLMAELAREVAAAAGDGK